MSLKIYSQTQNGRIFKCPNCTMIHFEFQNLNFNFNSIKEMEYTANYFFRLEAKLWETKNSGSFFRRKIFVPIGHKNFHILLNSQEALEIKKLFFISKELSEARLN